MKKIVVMVLALFLVLSACTSDSGDNSESTPSIEISTGRVTEDASDLTSGTSDEKQSIETMPSTTAAVEPSITKWKYIRTDCQALLQSKEIQDRTLYILPSLKTLSSAKNSCLIPSKYSERMADTYESEGRFADTHYKAYVYEDEGKYIIIGHLNEVLRYKLPFDFPEIDYIYSTYDCRSQFEYYEDYRERSGNLFLKAYDERKGSHSTYEIDMDKDTIIEHAYLSEFESTGSLEWSFQGELEYNRIEADTENTLIVSATDGGFSGYHADDYLYGIDKKSGKEIWSIYGYCYGFHFSISSDQKTICVKARGGYDPNTDTRLICIDINSGNIIWEKLFDISLGVLELHEIVSNSFVIINIKEKNENGLTNTIKAIDIKSGDTLWEHVNSYDWFYPVNSDATLFIVSDNERMFLYNRKTGETKKISDEVLYDRIDMPLLYYYPQYSTEGCTQWYVFENSYKLINYNTGAIISSIDRKIDVKLFFVDSDILLVKHEGSFDVYKVDGTNLWAKEGKFYGYVSENELIYYITGSNLVCAELLTGKTVWDKDFEFVIWEEEDKFFYNFLRKPVIVGNSIIVGHTNSVFVFDKLTGQFKYQLDGIRLGWYDLVTGANLYYGCIYSNEVGLYISHIDGYIDFYN